MRGCWRNFENKQAEKAIVGSACNPKRVSIGITLWLLTELPSVFRLPSGGFHATRFSSC